MKIVSFFEERPDEIPAGCRLYELAWKPRYDRTEDREPPAPLAGLRYFADGPTAIERPASSKARHLNTSAMTRCSSRGPGPAQVAAGCCGCCCRGATPG